MTIRRGTDAAAKDADNPLPSLVIEAAREFFIAARRAPFPFSCAIKSHVPAARGLGSSATVRLGVLHGLNALSGTRFGRKKLFVLASALEGHPDNAAAASFGGFTVVRNLHVQRFRVSPRVYFVLLVPTVEVRTQQARDFLPPNIPRSDAVKSAGNAAAIVAAFASAKYHELREAFWDGLHQPYRKLLLPFLDEVIASAVGAGALGAFLSGSGSAVCAITLDKPKLVAEAMMRAARMMTCDILVTRADNTGVRVLRSGARAQSTRE